MRKNKSNFVKALDKAIWTITDMKKYSEILFMFVFCVYGYVEIASISNLSLPLTSFFKGFFPVIIPVAAILQLITHAESKDKFVLGSIFMAALWILASLCGYESLRYLGMFAAGSIGVDHRKALKSLSFISLGIILVSFVYAFAIDPSLNVVYVSKIRIRSTAGFIYPTNIASLLLYACLMLFVVGESIPIYFTVAATVAAMLLSGFYYSSNTSTICSALLLVFMVYAMLAERASGRAVFKWIDRLLNIISVAAVPILAAAIFFFSMMYGSGYSWAVKLNDLIHNRFEYTYQGITSLGIRLIGQYVPMIGSSQPGMAKSDEYNFLDNSYIQLAVCFGMIASLVLAAIWFYILFRAIRGGNRRIVLVAIIIAIHSFEEHHFIDIGYNSLMFLPLAGFVDEYSPILNYRKLSGKAVTVCGALIAAALVVLLTAPFLFSATRAMVYRRNNDDMDISARIEADRDAVEIVMASHEEPVYADVLTADYAGEFKGIKRSIFSGEDLVRKLDCTIITDPEYSVAYFARGFLYSRISDYSAVYTTDRAVADALSEAGYHVAGYYYADTQINLAECHKSVSYPAFGTRGELTGTITLVGDAPAKGKICSLQVTSSEGTDAVFDYDADDFKKDGVLSYDVKFDTSHGDVTFIVKGYNGARLGVSDALFSCDDIIDDRRISFDTIEYSSEQYALYKGRYELKIFLEAAGEISDETSSFGTLTINPVTGKKITRDLTITNVSDNGEYTFDYKFSSSGSNYTFSIKKDKSVSLNALSAYYVVKPDYDYHYTYNRKGLLSRVEYYDLDGNKTYSDEGVFAYEYEYDRDGNRTVTRFYDQNGEPMNCEQGYAEVRREYDRLDNVVAERYFDVNGDPALCADGYASYEQEVNVWGSPTVIKYCGVDGNPVKTSLGYAEIHLEYDEKGNEITEHYYDVNGSRCTLPEGYSGCRFEYDDAGNKTLIVYIDDEEHPVNIGAGYAEIHSVYDENGRVTVQYYADAQGNTVTLEDDYDNEYASVTREYDKFGNNIATRYFSEDTSEGYIEIRQEFDSKKRLIYRGKFNSDGEGLILKDDYCAFSREYDENGNVSVITYYGSDGEPMLRDGEWSSVHREYDSEKRVISEAYYGTDGEKVLKSSGYHARGYEYDDNNNRNVIRYYGLDNEPVILKTYRYFEVRKTFDSSKNVVRMEYYGLEGEPVLYKKKYAAVENDYNDSGKVTQTRYYDLEGNLIETK